MQLKKYIEGLNPEILVKGEEYPAPAAIRTLAMLVQVAQFGFILFIAFGDQLFQSFQVQPPQFYQKIKESSWTYGIMAFFVGN